MMEEVISRRLKHTEWPYPDLMLIDGGKGQLSSVLKAISNLIRLSYPQLNRIKLQKMKVMALAKRNNELFSPKRTHPVLLKDLSQEVSNLLLHIRDEAHRFAVTYHRKLRKIDAIGTS
jgi:excinuclease ABC subunit C